MKSRSKVNKKGLIKLFFIAIIVLGLFHFFTRPTIEGMYNVNGTDISGNTLSENSGITMYQSYIVRTILNNTVNSYSDDDKLKDIRDIKIDDAKYKSIIKNSDKEESGVVLKKINELLKTNEQDMCARANWEKKPIPDNKAPEPAKNEKEKEKEK